MDIKLELENVDEDEMYALADFLKRVGFEDYRRNAESHFQATQISIAVTRLQSAIERAGYEVW